LQEFLTFNQLKLFSQEKIVHLQTLRFRATCRYLLPNVPFYKKLFAEYNVDPNILRNVEDWQKNGLPLIKKAAYMKNPKDFVVQPGKDVFKEYVSLLSSQHEFDELIKLLFSDKEKELKQYYSPKMLVFSGGTESGNPTPVMLTAKQKFDTLVGVLEVIGKLLFTHTEKKTVGMNLFPYAPHLGWHATHMALDINTDLNLGTAAGGAMPTERLVMLADKTKPNVICGMSDYLRNRFLPLAVQKKIKLSEKVVFVNGAQKMHDAERVKIKQLAKKLGVKQCTVLDMYGASELKEALMPECVEGSGFHHVAPLSTIVRTVEAKHTTKDLIDDWQFSYSGYAVSWNIDGAGTLLQGYFLGDKYDKIETNKCDYCRLNVQRFFGVNRIREVETQLNLTGIVEEKVKGTRVNLVAYRGAALSLDEIKEAQVVLKKNKVEVRIVSDKPKKAIAKLEKKFASAEIKPIIKCVSMDDLKNDKLKFKPIVIG